MLKVQLCGFSPTVQMNFERIELLEVAENLFGKVLPQFKIFLLSTVYFEKSASVLVGTRNGTDVRSLI